MDKLEDEWNERWEIAWGSAADRPVLSAECGDTIPVDPPIPWEAGELAVAVVYPFCLTMKVHSEGYGMYDGYLRIAHADWNETPFMLTQEGLTEQEVAALFSFLAMRELGTVGDIRVQVLSEDTAEVRGWIICGFERKENAVAPVGR